MKNPNDLTVRLDKDLKAWLRTEAAHKKVSMAWLVNRAVELLKGRRDAG